MCKVFRSKTRFCSSTINSNLLKINLLKIRKFSANEGLRLITLRSLIDIKTASILIPHPPFIKSRKMFQLSLSLNIDSNKKPFQYFS